MILQFVACRKLLSETKKWINENALPKYQKYLERYVIMISWKTYLTNQPSGISSFIFL